jgi:DNA topoisomerase IB
LKDKPESEKKVAKAIVVLIHNTTWRCGKLERLIMKHLYGRRTTLGTREMPVSDILQSLELAGKKKNELLDAVKRLERRNIIKILKLVN